MRRSWIKLYVEALDDPKLAELPESVCWRFAQLLLVAAESDEGGILPASKRLAWRLRADQAQLLDDLRAMSEVGIVCRQGERWKVTNFEKRQASLTEAERSAQYRARKHHPSVTEGVTQGDAAVVAGSTSTSASASPSGSVLSGEGVQGEGGPSPNTVLQTYQANIGAITPLIAEALLDDEREYGAEWVCAAIQEAVRNEVRNLKYAEAILARWKRDGFGRDKRRHKSGKAGSMQDVHDMLQGWLEEQAP